MNQYTVALSDRKRRRTVRAYSGTDAVQLAVGGRFINCREDSWNQAGESTYNVAVQTGRTVGGATPFRNIFAYVTRVKP